MIDTLQRASTIAFETVFGELRAIAAEFSNNGLGNWAKNGKLTNADIKQIRPSLAMSLLRLDGRAFSLGIILDENVIAGTSYSLCWLERADDGSVQEDSNIRYPWRDSFYEYTKADWMNLPRLSREPVVVGPYVDFDKYLLTLAVPLIISEQFVGVAAADLHVDDFERSIAYPLSTCESDCLIVNADGRVVVSNTTTYPVGSISSANRELGTVIGPYGWRVIILSGSDRKAV